MIILRKTSRPPLALRTHQLAQDSGHFASLARFILVVRREGVVFAPVPVHSSASPIAFNSARAALPK
jgi:hypothetical protein